MSHPTAQACLETEVLGYPLWVSYTAEGIVSATFEKPAEVPSAKGDAALEQMAKLIGNAIAAYNAGDYEAVESIPRTAESRSAGYYGEAQDAMDAIPAGTTVSYSELAFMAGNPKAHRAAASACASNPIPIFRPCHRVVTKDHKLGGFAFDIGIKAKLLAHEGAQL
ncbi:MAG: MGMT family protein [Actinomycetota bacterium]|nr:MGMT family protein [Actinomycetota bacterium]